MDAKDRVVTCVVDTHTLLWFLSGDKRLGERAKALMDDASTALLIPTVVLVEALGVIERGRSAVTPDELRTVTTHPRVKILPLHQSIVWNCTQVHFTRDLFDRMIVASTMYAERRHGKVALLTRDEVISASDFLTTIW